MSDENQNEGQEKTFDASETKIRKSREKGDTPQSTEANTLMLYIGLATLVALFSGGVISRLFESLSAMLTYPSMLGESTLQDRDGQALGALLIDISVATMPLFAVPILFIVASLLAQRAVVFAPDKIKPKMSRISPITNVKEKYGPNGIVEFLKRLAKMTFIAVIAGFFFYQAFFNLSGMSSMAEHYILFQMKEEALKLTFYMIVAMAVITLIDMPYAQFSHMRKLRMTFQEVKDEAKETEGDPHMKSARRQRAQEIAQSTMLRDVAKSNVVIVNPTHYAVALKWDRSAGEVPMCLAKGIDGMAVRIREQAELHDVPIYSDPPCARSLHALVEVGEPIRYEHYAAVAAAIHFADKSRTKAY